MIKSLIFILPLPADDMQFRDAEPQGFLGLFHQLRDGQLEAIRIALLAGEGAELQERMQ